MLRVYKEIRNGKEASKWTVMFKDLQGRRRKISAFSTRRATDSFSLQLDKLMEYQASGKTLEPEQIEWLESLPRGITVRLAKYGVLKDSSIANATCKMLMTAHKTTHKFSKNESIVVTEGHLYDYQEHLKAKECHPRHINDTISHCARLVEQRSWMFPTDITTTGIECYIRSIRERGKSARWANAALVAIKSFINWMLREERMRNNPAARLKKLNEKADRRHIRRPLTAAQAAQLIVATENGDFHHGLTGQERAFVYKLALGTGLRYNEIRTLSQDDFNLEAATPSVTIRPENEKAGRGETLPISKELANSLLEYFELLSQTLFGSELAFVNMQIDRGSVMLRRDLDAAGIDWTKDSTGAIIDFHSLRHTFGTMLAQNGVHPKTAQDLMRHSTINLTMNLYTHTVLEDRAKATEGLPDFRTCG